jgi:hypothetical protein
VVDDGDGQVGRSTGEAALRRHDPKARAARQHYDKRVVDALRTLVPADGAPVDVGAGDGGCTHMARSVARVIAIEPSDSMKRC